MFTKNYIKFREMLFTCTSKSFTHTGNSATGNATISCCYGTGEIGCMAAPKIGTIPVPVSGYSSSPSYDRSGTYFGSGATPATPNDYTLESPITSGLTATSGGTALFKEAEGLYAYEQRYLLYNYSSTNISVQEIGQIRTITYVNNAQQYYHYPVLMDRTVLPEPVHIAPGETKLITYRINFNQMLNVE